MTGGDPLWLQIVLGLVPILAAITAGIFALTNTFNNKVDRFKALVEARRDYPQELNPGHALDNVILGELLSLVKFTDPATKEIRESVFTSVAFTSVAYVVGVITALGVGDRWQGYGVALVSLVVGLVTLGRAKRRLMKRDDRLASYFRKAFADLYEPPPSDGKARKSL